MNRRTIGVFDRRRNEEAGRRQLESGARLLPRDRKLIQLRVEGKTFEEIGAMFGFSRAWAHSAHARAISNVKARREGQGQGRKVGAQTLRRQDATKMTDPARRSI